jgi:hypothetical protein
MAKNSKVKSNARMRKIDHVRELIHRGEKREKIKNKALHHMKMLPEDLQEAFGDNIY